MSDEKQDTTKKADEAVFAPAVEEEITDAEGRKPTNPRAFCVLIERVESDEPVICIPVEYKGEYRYFRPDPAKKAFEVDVLTARAAVATGGFTVSAKSKMKLKEV